MTQNGTISVKALLGSRIRHLRKQKKLSIADLAAKAEISQKYLGEIELGKQNPTVDVVERISQVFEMSLSELFEFEHHGTLETLRYDLVKIIERTTDIEFRRLYRIIKSIVE